MRERQENDCADIMGRIPYASLIALMLCWIGVGLFCTMMYQAIHASVDQAKVLLGQPTIDWLDKLQVSFILVAVVMTLLALVLLVVAALATGATRARVYDGVRAKLGGRIGCALFMLLTYVMQLCWLVVLSITAVLVSCYVVFSRLCAPLMPIPTKTGGSDDGPCLDFTSFAPIVLAENANPASLNLCNSRLGKFCALTDTAATWYYVAYGGALLVLLGLVHFMVCMAANYVRIERGSKYQELEAIWASETNEMAAYDAYQGARPNTAVRQVAPPNQPATAVKQPFGRRY